MNLKEMATVIQFNGCWPWIERAIAKSNQPCDREYVLAEIVAGAAQLWPGQRSAIVTRIEEQSDGSKILFGWLAGGDRAEIDQMSDIAAAWGRDEHGCIAFRSINRLGFLGRGKAFKGFRPIAVVMERAL